MLYLSDDGVHEGIYFVDLRDFFSSVRDTIETIII